MTLRCREEKILTDKNFVHNEFCLKMTGSVCAKFCEVKTEYQK